jgi:hypothetical protein
VGEEDQALHGTAWGRLERRNIGCYITKTSSQIAKYSFLK